MGLSINSTSAQKTNYISTTQYKSQLKNLGIPDDIISQGETAIKNYASENGITLPTNNAQTQENLFDNNEQSAAASSMEANNSNNSNKKLNFWS